MVDDGSIPEVSQLHDVGGIWIVVSSLIAVRSKESFLSRWLSFSLAWAAGVACWANRDVDDGLCSMISDMLLLFRIGFLSILIGDSG